MHVAFHDFDALGTTGRVIVTRPESLAAAVAAVRHEVQAIDAACSRFRGDSELSRLNAAGGQPVKASPLFLEALRVALRASRLTGGIVDPMVGEALVQLGYASDFASLARQGGPVPESGWPSPGWRVVEMDQREQTVRIPNGSRLDLGATAKALASDRAARAAAAATGVGALVGLGGDVAVAGEAPPGGWCIRVTDDCRTVDGPGETVSIASGGLATSSTTVRRWTRGGASLHHILDPATGRPAREYWRTASVAAATCVDANVAATAAIVLGETAPRWLTEHRLPARLITRDGHVCRVGGWPEPGRETSTVVASGRMAVA
ncbi:MAG: FAD:protein FMN transferase [Chloroflexota bacterium]